jgi:fatty-acyl-CoA synthase
LTERWRPNLRTLWSRSRILAADICSYFHTGGTTGLPKVAMHSHLNEAFVACMLDAMVPSPNTILCGLPLFHVNGAMVTGLPRSTRDRRW